MNHEELELKMMQRISLGHEKRQHQTSPREGNTMNHAAYYHIYHGIATGMLPPSYDERHNQSYHFKADRVERAAELAYEHLVYLAASYVPQTTGETIAILTGVVDEQRLIPLEDLVARLDGKTTQPATIQRYNDSTGILFRCGLLESYAYREKGLHATAWTKREVRP